MGWWWVSSERMTFAVKVDGYGIVTEAAPIARKFIGQPAANLGAWMRRQGGFLCERL